MIEVIGESGTNEYSAAISVAEALGSLWPGLANSPANQELVRIAASVKISGYRVSDIDVVVCGLFYRERRFIPKKIIHDKNGKRVFKEPVTVQNFVVVIEVKDHSEERVQIVGDKILVKYSKGGSIKWESATDQNVNQVHSLQPYLKDRGLDIYVYRCVFMRGLSSIGIGGAIVSGFNGIDFFTALASVSNVSFSSRGYTLSSGLNETILSVSNAPIFKSIVPTALDRRRMDIIVTSTAESNTLQKHFGRKLLQLRGHGGTGKTIMLLQAAWKAYSEKGMRTLVLTYNHALAADIRRLLALLNVPSNPEDGGVVVVTVMSYMFSWLTSLGIISEGEEFLYEKYNQYCTTALDLLKAGAITSNDIESNVNAHTADFDFDCVVIDEAQDWPQAEVDLLKFLHEPTKICLADGIDQLLRGGRPDWLGDIGDEDRVLITLNKCLRMKRNLAVFNNQIAEVAQIKWNVVPNDMAGGGRVILLLRPYFECEGLHESLVKAAKDKGNAELDFLFCVPSSSVKATEQRKYSDIAESLSDAGYEVWDGVDELVRKDFPRAKTQFRVVQYASCRGLEGWTVILNNADDYWHECERVKERQGLTKDEELAFEEISEASAKQAWLRMMIALTRPIDTLVISLRDLNSDFSKNLLDLASKNKDFIEV